jgi:hypothetical protein
MENTMPNHPTALTAYDCRDRFPNLTTWMDDDTLKQLSLWHESHLTPDEEYFDLANPERGPFVAGVDEWPVTADRSYIARKQIPLRAWTQLVTWHKPISQDQGEALEAQERALGLKTE